MKIQTNEMTRAALDWAVAKCQGYFDEQPEYWATAAGAKHFMDMRDGDVHWTRSSTNWSEGGPIIDREGINTWPERNVKGKIKKWCADNTGYDDAMFADGPTPLIAAMRCYVASKLGNDVDVPEELK